MKRIGWLSKVWGKAVEHFVRVECADCGRTLPAGWNVRTRTLDVERCEHCADCVRMEAEHDAEMGMLDYQEAVRDGQIRRRQLDRQSWVGDAMPW